MGRQLIVGLGNPDPCHQGNRHNVGFMVVDKLADDARISLTRKKFGGVYGKGPLGDGSAVLLKPLTYMNLSGRSVAPAARFFDFAPEEVLVVHDELDLPFGTIRLKVGGGHAGHNGLRSIQAELGTNAFHRLRVGIGRPERGSVSHFVLSDFSAGDERDWLPDLTERCAQAVMSVMRDGIRKAMNTVNEK